MDKYTEMFNFINEAQETFSQILSSGFSTCHDYTIEKIKELKETSHYYGMEYAEEKLGELYDDLYLKNHKFEFDFNKVIEKLCKLNEYFLICRDRLQIENVKRNLNNTKGEL